MNRQMRIHTALLVALVALALALAGIAGCVSPQATPLQRVALAKQTATITATSLNQMIDAGRISSESDKAAIRSAALAVDAAIRIMESAAVAGDDATYKSAHAKLNAALDALIAQRIAAEGRSP